MSVTDYIIKIFKKGHIKIDDKYVYFKVSAERNIKALEFKKKEVVMTLEKKSKISLKQLGNSD